MSSLRSVTALCTTAAFLVACSDDPTGPDPELTLTVTPAAISIEQGASGSSAITVMREGSDDDVTVSVTGGGTFVIGTIADVEHDGDETTATLNVNVTAAAEPGAYTFTVKAANGDADDVTKVVTVTVTEAEGGGQN